MEVSVVETFITVAIVTIVVAVLMSIHLHVHVHVFVCLFVCTLQVLQIIPQSMFVVLHEIITILTNEMKEVLSCD